jgi:uncharacterized protein (TIGR03437 family)
MLRTFLLWATGAMALMAGSATGATFGTPVPIGGQALDLAIDEPRGVLYIADFTANRIDVMSLATWKIQGSIPVAPHPGSMSLSPDRRWLLVAHFDNQVGDTQQNNLLTAIDLNQNTQHTLKLNDPPLAVAFGADGLGFVVTTKEYLLYSPSTNTVSLLDTVADVTAKTIPAPPATFPLDITAASMSASADGMTIYGVGSSTGTITFHYDVATHTVTPGEIVLASGALGPRVVSLNRDGSRVMVGWFLFDRGTATNNFVPRHSNQFSVGTSIFDDTRGLIYAQIPAVEGEDPSLQILAADNLTVLDRLQLPENTTGKSVMNAAQSVMYAISDSGVLVLPVGYLDASHRLAVSAPSVLVQGNFCDSSMISRTLTITDPSGGKTAFAIKSSDPGVTVSPASGTTPATVTVTIDPGGFSGIRGTAPVTLTVSSSEAINLVPPVRVLVNHAEPNQRGTLVEVPGQLVDLLADPVRDQYYVLRQDNNTVLVFDGANHTQIRALRTNNVPTTMAITFDNRYLLIGHDSSQTLAVYDLDDFSRLPDVSTSAGNGDVVRSLAVASNQIVATARDYKGQGHVVLFDPALLGATQPDALGVWKNDVAPGAVATATADGSQVMVAAPDGNVFLYDATVGDFTVSRSDFATLGGSYGASQGLFTVDNHVLDGSLVPIADLDASAGNPSGFVFTGGGAIRTGAPDSTSAGFIERVDLATGSAILPTATVEAPILGSASTTAFTRSLAALPFHGTLVSLSVSGLTVFPPNYDAPQPQPLISSVASAADGSSQAASGGLISILGSNLSPASVAASDSPLPTILGNSCVTVNGQPISLLYVSSTQINAQLSYQTAGNISVVVRTPQNVSPAFDTTVSALAPAVFLNGQAGPYTNLPSIVRASNGLLVTVSNPVHHNDTLTILAAGLGLTAPAVAAGSTSPTDPLAVAVAQPKVSLGGVGLPVEFAGLVPGEIGVYEITVTVPRWTPLGLSVPLTITQGGVSQTVMVRVVN